MRYIQLTEELKNKALEDFKNKLDEGRFSDSKINFSFDLKNTENLTDENKIILNVRAEAWLKMWSLVQTESGEIGWHGLVNRINAKMFEITDILLYPQFVTGVTVQTDDVGYGNWLHKEISDEDINHLRFHGHSHVNMGTTPSGVDTTWYNEILQGLLNDDFYIFMILNKREDYFIEIYDLATNTIYEKKDILINVILSDNNYLQNWVTQSKKKALQEKTRTTGFKTFNTSKDDSEEAFEDLILSLTSADLKDTTLIKGVLEELSRKAIWCNYFGAGYLKWGQATDAEKIEIAQEYYEPNTILDKQIAYKKQKSKRGKSKKYTKAEQQALREWEDYYDKYY